MITTILNGKSSGKLYPKLVKPIVHKKSVKKKSRLSTTIPVVVTPINTQKESKTDNLDDAGKSNVTRTEINDSPKSSTENQEKIERKEVVEESPAITDESTSESVPKDQNKQVEVSEVMEIPTYLVLYKSAGVNFIGEVKITGLKSHESCKSDSNYRFKDAAILFTSDSRERCNEWLENWKVRKNFMTISEARKRNLI